MDATSDELAGVVDLFGGLRREELERALGELAARTDGATVEERAVDDALARAVDGFALVDLEVDGEAVYVPGPTAFPELPDHGEDLPHIMDVPKRSFDRETLGGRVADRFAASVERAVAADDRERARELIDVSYDAEAWGPVELADERSRLDDLLG